MPILHGVKCKSGVFSIRWGGYCTRDSIDLDSLLRRLFRQFSIMKSLKDWLKKENWFTILQEGSIT